MTNPSQDSATDRFPLELPSAVTSAGTTAPTLRAGQVWRARWDDVLTLVIIDTVLCEYTNEVRVAPVTIGDEDADDSAVILPADISDLNVTLSVWPEMVAEIPALVLERWVSAIARYADLATIVAAAKGGELLRGLPILRSDSPRRRERRLLELAMEVLASAAHVTGGTGHLPAMLAEISSSQLALTLEVTPAVARNIRRGRAILGPHQAELVGALVGVPALDLLAANPEPPSALIEDATRLDRGPAIRAIAAAHHESDSDAFADLIQNVWGLVARGDQVDSEDWSGRIDTYIQVVLAD